MQTRRLIACLDPDVVTPKRPQNNSRRRDWTLLPNRNDRERCRHWRHVVAKRTRAHFAGRRDTSNCPRWWSSSRWWFSSRGRFPIFCCCLACSCSLSRCSSRFVFRNTKGFVTGAGSGALGAMRSEDRGDCTRGMAAAKSSHRSRRSSITIAWWSPRLRCTSSMTALHDLLGATLDRCCKLVIVREQSFLNAASWRWWRDCGQ